MPTRWMLLWVLSACLCASFAAGEEPVAVPDKPAPSKLEGTLRIHPKFLYRYYLADFGDGQKCALLGMEEKLKDIPPGSFIHVEGQLSTRFHPGSTAANLSPFPRTWYIAMEVESVKVLRDPVPPAPEPPANPTLPR